MRRVSFFFILSLFLFSGCVSQKLSVAHKQTSQKKLPPYHLQEKTPIREALYDEYKKWYGVKYCYGGVSKNGIDCSALVQNIYYDAFRIKVPRTTLLQAKSGYFIKKSKIKEGDLILFKTGWRSHHSGIYIEHGNFLHASSKHGVTISNLNNPYWRGRYWQTRRVLAR